MVSKAHIFNAVIIFYFFLRTLDKTTTTNLEEESTSSKLKEDSKVPQMESDVQLPVDEVNAKVSVQICVIQL